MNAATGAKLWNYTTGSGIDSSPAVVGGVVYVGSEDDNVYALNAANGIPLWNYTTRGNVYSSPAIVNGVLYVGSFDGNVYALGVPSLPVPTATPTTTQTPSPTPLATVVPATTESGATVDLSISGNITSSQMSNVTIATDQSTASTTLSFTVTGESGTIGFGNITIPISAVTYGTTPTIYIDGQIAPNQGYTQDSNNYYVWYTTQFSTHQISIVFTTTPNITPVPSHSPTPQPSLLQEAIYGVVAGLAIAAIVVAALMFVVKGKKDKGS